MELHGIRKKNICLNIFSCVIWFIIALEMLGNLLLLLIFSGLIEQYVDNLEINDKHIIIKLRGEQNSHVGECCRIASGCWDAVM